jgi:filamentous hemagglutinin family protein
VEKIMKASLNHIFRTIWSDALNTWVAVSEITSAKGKRSGSCVLNAATLADNDSEAGNLVKRNRLRFKPIAITLACCFSLNAQANPIGAQVANGTASFNQSGNLLTITNSPSAIINWQSFSIGSGETTRFIQQSASSSVLNRVVGADPSALLGTLTSNGRVFLINPAGILVGQGANINVPGFVASTLNLSDSNFLAGKLNFDATPNAGAIQNNGTITTPEGGSVYLIAPQVTNNGIITTPKGETILAAGNTVQLMDTGTPGVTVQITGSGNTATNLGQIIADSGRIGMVGALVNNSGTISANSLVSQGGKVFLIATQDTYVAGQGRIEATGTTGGSIEVLGNRVAVTDNASLDASGTNGGGTILIGGDAHGANPLIQNAQDTFVGSNATINADATQNGNGGKVVVWADGLTQFNGTISAQGGAQSGNGGWVETSGKQTLGFAGLVNTTAAHGVTGTLLLDPTDITISTNANTVTMTNSSGTFTDSTVSSPYISNLNTGTLQTALASNNVIVDTSNTAGFTGGSVDNGLLGNGNITVLSSIAWNSAHSLTLLAAHDITVSQFDLLSAPLSIANAGAGALTLNAVNSITNNGTLSSGGQLSLTSGNTITNNGTLTSTFNNNATGDTFAALTTGGQSVDTVAGGILLAADNMIFGGSSNITASTGTVIFTTYTGGASIDVGGGTPALGSLLSLNFNGNVTARAKVIATVGGNITVDSAMTSWGGSEFFLAGGNVTANQSISSIDSNVMLMAGWNGSRSGALAVTQGTGNININANANVNAPSAKAIALFAGGSINIADAQVISGGNMTVNVGGNLNLIANTSQTLLQSNGTQTINFTGTGAVAHQMIIQGSNNSDHYGASANVESSGLQTISYDHTGGSAGSTLDIQVAGGNANNNSLNAYVYINNAQTGTSVCANLTNCATYSGADIQSFGGQTISASTIEVTGGRNGNGNNANIENKSSSSTDQYIHTTGLITITGGASGGYINLSYLNDGVGNEAHIQSDWTQHITAGSIALIGGGAVQGGAFLTGKVSQNITTTTNLSMTGGSSGTAGQYGFGAPAIIGEQYGANITLNIGGTLTMAGDGSTINPALIGSADGAYPVSVSITAAAISMTSGSEIGVLTNGPAGTLTMTATAGNIFEDTSSAINMAKIFAYDTTALSSSGNISLGGANQAGQVTATSDNYSITYNSDGTAHLVMTAPTGITVTSTTASGSNLYLGLLTSTGGNVSVTADGAIKDDNGSGNNITANNIYLYSTNGGVSGQLAISADTRVATGGVIDAEVDPNNLGGAAYGGISIRNVGATTATTGAPGSVVLTDNSINGGSTSFTHVGSIDDTLTSITATTKAGNISIGVTGNLTESGNISVTTPGLATVSAGGNMSITSGITTSGDLALTAGGTLDISGTSTSTSGNLTLTAPTITVEGSTSSSYNTQINASSSLTMSGGNITAYQNVNISAGSILADSYSSIYAPNNNVTAHVTGDISLNNGSYIEAGNDVSLSFASPTSTLSLNNLSYILANASLTTDLNFLTRTSGGVLIDGVSTLTTTPTGSGIFTGSYGTPAVPGAGLNVTYAQNLNQSQLVTTLAPPPTVPPPPPTSGQTAAPFVVVISTPSGTGGTMPGMLGSPGATIGGTTGTFGGTEESGSPGNGGTTGSATSNGQSDSGNGNAGSGGKGSGGDKGNAATGSDNNKGKQNAKPEKC